MRIFSMLLLSLTALIAISFAILNATPVRVDYYIGTQEIPLSLLLVGSFILGILFGVFLLFPTLVRRRLEIRRLRRGIH